MFYESEAAQAMEAVVEMNDVRAGYDGTDVLHGINLTLEKGSFTAVTGHNGSGKSTLAKCLNGFVQPSTGTVRTCGFNPAEKTTQPQLRRRAGMVFQHPDNQIVAPTVADDIAFGLENAGIPTEEMQERVAAAITRFGLDGFEDREPHRLSGGQKQRVALAGVTALRPELIILDEATSMLDPEGRVDMRHVIRQLAEDSSVTVLSVTHEMEEAAEADRVLVLQDGHIVLDGSPRNVYAEADVLEAAGLRPPLPVRISASLRKEDAAFRHTMSQEELVSALCRSK
ncbi:energy-coupling factor transporter ATPase [Alkalicoccus chagannorensis]|uniref:energy-coupling factor transporter ATPase n=1 Tax=Alkalicoccus chagannorensis TaxID=427072 RepID=UPI001476F6BF|nr:energy-coupling factor transporter ATPase [Alkalicoccus chagannorensis]